MTRHLVINAYSSNSGGGRSGLVSLISAIPLGMKATVFVDARFDLPFQLPSNVQLKRVEPTLLARYQAEKEVRDTVQRDDVFLRLGSVPPFFKLSAPALVFFENRLLLNSANLWGMPLKQFLRVVLERVLIRVFKKNAAYFIVQSPAVAEDLKSTLGETTPVRVMPFHATQILGASPNDLSASLAKDIDFIYPSTGEPHKNHHNLIRAWIKLADMGFRPSLVLTVERTVYPELASWIDLQKTKYGLNINNVGFLKHRDLLSHYARSKALIFPSRVESFGRPLIEGQEMGLPTLAPELDYVRDVLDPKETFDANSPVSIARAVKRFLGGSETRAKILGPKEFLLELMRVSD